MRPAAWLPLLLFLAGLGLRLPTVRLPLEGDAAVLASVSELVGHERGWVPPGTPPTLPLLSGAVVAAGVDPTSALRWTDLVLGALAAPLAFCLARRLGQGTGRALGWGLLLAAHPFLALNAGGVHPGPDALGLALLLGALCLLVAAGPAARRLGALLALLLAVSHPAGALYLLPLLAAHVRAEPGPRWQVALPGLGVAVLLAGPLPVTGPGGGGANAAGLLLGGLPLWGLGVIWLGLPRGLRLLWAPGAPPGRRRILAAWSVGALLHAVALGAGALGRPVGLFLERPSGGALLVPFVLLAGLTGLSAWGGRPLLVRRLRRLAPAAAGGVGLALSAWILLGPLQVALRPDAPGAAGRLTWLRDAVHAAADAAGEEGWVVLDVAGDEPQTQASLADAVPGRAVCRQGPLPEEPEEEGLRVLLPFPARAYPAHRAFAMVVPAPRRGTDARWRRVTTLGGAGIFAQEPVARVGAYLVLRVQGTQAAEGRREDE